MTFIERITIPSEFRIIGKYAFSEESKLQTIEEGVFNRTSISSIIIPCEVTDLKEGCFYSAYELIKVNVSLLNP